LQIAHLDKLFFSIAVCGSFCAVQPNSAQINAAQHGFRACRITQTTTYGGQVQLISHYMLCGGRRGRACGRKPLSPQKVKGVKIAPYTVMSDDVFFDGRKKTANEEFSYAAIRVSEKMVNEVTVHNIREIILFINRS